MLLAISVKPTTEWYVKTKQTMVGDYIWQYMVSLCLSGRVLACNVDLMLFLPSYEPTYESSYDTSFFSLWSFVLS